MPDCHSGQSICIYILLSATNDTDLSFKSNNNPTSSSRTWKCTLMFETQQKGLPSFLLCHQMLCISSVTENHTRTRSVFHDADVDLESSEDRHPALH